MTIDTDATGRHPCPARERGRFSRPSPTPCRKWSGRPCPTASTIITTAAGIEFTGVPDGSTDGEGWNGMFHPDDQARAWKAWGACLATRRALRNRISPAPPQRRISLDDRPRAIRFATTTAQIVRWIGTCTDIDSAKRQAEAERNPEPRTEPPDQEYLRGDQRPDRPVGAPEARSEGIRRRTCASASRRLAARMNSRGRTATNRACRSGTRRFTACLREMLKPYPALDEGRISSAATTCRSTIAARRRWRWSSTNWPPTPPNMARCSMPDGRIDVTSRLEGKDLIVDLARDAAVRRCRARPNARDSARGWST